MSYLYTGLTAHNQIAHMPTRKAFEELREIIRKLEDLAEQRALALNKGDTFLTYFDIMGTPSATLSYPFAIFANDQFFPNGCPIDFQRAVKIKRCFIQADPSLTASAATTFTLGNAATSPTSSGTVTIANGASHGLSTSLGVSIGVGQRLFIRSPATLNSIQNVYLLRLEWENV